MALFKVNRGNSTTLPSTLTDGWAYFCTDTGEFFIDYSDENGDLYRKQINAYEARKLIGYDIKTVLNNSDIEIPTSKVVLDTITNKIDETKEYANTLIESSVADWNQNDEVSSDYIKNRPFYDSRETIKTEEVTINATTGAFGTVKVADSIDFDIDKIKTMTLVSNTGAEFEDIPVSVIYYLQGYNIVASDNLNRGLAVYLETEEDADVWFDGESHEGAGLYVIVFNDDREDVSFYYSFAYEDGEIVQLDPMYIKDMYYDIPYIENSIPEFTITFSEDYGFTALGLGYYTYFVEGETYTVICNGVEYSCVAWADGTEVYLGNGDINGGGPSNNEPFVFTSWSDEFVKLHIATFGTYTISVSRNARDLKQIDPKYIPASNWNQNDVDGEGYIDNRTHWAEEVKQKQTLVDNVTLNFSGTNAITGPFALNIIAGRIYTVIWDEVEYQCKASRTYSSSYGGDCLILKNDAFRIYVPLDGSEITVRDEANTGGNHTISIASPMTIEVVHHLDPKYIKDMYCENGGEQIALVENLTYEDYDNWNFSGCTFVIGNSYNVIWNGVLYENLICVGHDGYATLGNPDELPFYINDDGGDSLYVSVNAGDETSWYSWTVSIFETVPYVIHKIDPKYLPDDIGGNSDWNQDDEFGKGYIKNKPFGDNKQQVTILDIDYNENTAPSWENGWDMDMVPLMPGQSYTVIINDDIYTNLIPKITTFANGETIGILINNETLGYQCGIYNVPYFYREQEEVHNKQFSYGVSYGLFGENIPSPCRLRILTDEKIPYQMSGKYIKDMYYEEQDEETIISVDTNVDSNWDYFYHHVTLFEGDSYNVIWNGAESGYSPVKEIRIQYTDDVNKERVCNFLYIGNATLLSQAIAIGGHLITSLENTGENYVFYIDDGGWDNNPVKYNHGLGVVFREEPETVVVKHIFGSTIHKIDPKYLPDNIGGKKLATEEYVDNSIASIPAQVQADWDQTDVSASDFIKNKPIEMTEDDMVELLFEMGAIAPVTNNNGLLYTNSNNQIYIL